MKNLERLISPNIRCWEVKPVARIPAGDEKIVSNFSQYL